MDVCSSNKSVQHLDSSILYSSEKMRQLSKELAEERLNLAKTNYIIQILKERRNTVPQELQTKVDLILKTKEMQTVAKCKGKNGEVYSLFGLTDSDISAYYGDDVLDSGEKQCLREAINSQIVNELDNLTDNSVFEEFATPFFALDNKCKTLQLLETLETKITSCKKLLAKVEDHYTELGNISSNNEIYMKSLLLCLMQEAKDLTVKAKIFKLKIEEAMRNENKDIVEALKVLKNELEKLLMEDTIKLEELNKTLNKYKEIEGNKEFQSILDLYLKRLESIKRTKYLLQLAKDNI